MQYTIEERPLTRESPRRPSFAREPRRMVIEAEDPDHAITQFLAQSASQLVSMTRPARGSESIATIRKDDSVYLVRVYAA